MAIWMHSTISFAADLEPQRMDSSLSGDTPLFRESDSATARQSNGCRSGSRTVIQQMFHLCSSDSQRPGRGKDKPFSICWWRLFGTMDQVAKRKKTRSI